MHLLLSVSAVISLGTRSPLLQDLAEMIRTMKYRRRQYGYYKEWETLQHKEDVQWHFCNGCMARQ